MTNFELRIRPQAGNGESGSIQNSKFKIQNFTGFSLIEVLVAVALMSLIVIALMAVFSSTQAAFRASVTQTDVLEGGRAAMELITQDLRQMTPSGGKSNKVNGAVNFSVLANNNNYLPLVQGLPGSSVQRTNLLNYFFVLSRQNTKWIGVGYVVDNTNSSPLYPLYRFYAETNIAASPRGLFNAFTNAIYAPSPWTNMSHVMDGVVHLTVRANDTNGVWMNNTVRPYTNVQNTLFFSSPPVQYGYGEAQFYMFSNTVPASVELQLGVLEDRPLQHAGSLPTALRTQYLQQQSGRVHLFRQLVTIPNVDPTAYQ
jgi:type II secretory pathway pseudopilin PulG